MLSAGQAVLTTVRLIEQAAGHSDPADNAAALDTALRLWRGRPLADIGGLSWLDAQAERLDDLRRRAECARIDARLELGEHASLAPELQRLVREHPFDERFHGQLMPAVYRAGRQADALGVFRRLRTALCDDLGIDPTPVLRDLEASILRHEPALDLSSALVAGHERREPPWVNERVAHPTG